MSGHDRGAFGQLLTELKDLGGRFPAFVADLNANPEASDRWTVTCVVDGRMNYGHGRTGEEAMRALVTAIKARE